MKKAVALGAVLVLALLTGCGGGGSSSAARAADERVATTTDAPAEADATLQTNGPYVGMWTAELTLEQLGEAAADTRYAGKFRLELRDDGTYTMFQELDGETTGTYGAVGDAFLVFDKDSGCDERFRGSSTYEWAVDGDDLTLTLARPESGGCTARSDTLTIPVWKRS